MLNAERTKSGNVMVVRLEGDIDEDGVKVLRSTLLDCLKEQSCHVVVNLSEVKFVSYLGVGVLVERLRQLRCNGGDLKLVGLNMYSERLLRMVGVASLFDVHDNEALAVESYQEAA